MEKDYEKEMESLGAILAVNCIDNQNDINYINEINEISKKVQEALKLIPDVLKEDIQNRINEHNIKGALK